MTEYIAVKDSSVSILQQGGTPVRAQYIFTVPDQAVWDAYPYFDLPSYVRQDDKGLADLQLFFNGVLQRENRSFSVNNSRTIIWTDQATPLYEGETLVVWYRSL